METQLIIWILMYVGGFEIFFQLILYPYLDCWNGLTRLLQQHQQRRRHVHVQSSPIPSIQMLFTKVNCTVWYRISASRYDAESGLMSSSLFEQSIESKSGTSLLFKGFKFTFKRLRLKIRLLQQKIPSSSATNCVKVRISSGDKLSTLPAYLHLQPALIWRQ